MGLTYRNIKSGKVVTMPEPSGYKTRRMQQNARRALEKLDVSKRWERLSEPSEIEASRRAWEQARQAKTTRRPSAPTPVYVVNQQPDPEPAVEVDPEPEEAGAAVNEVRHTGGPWFEVVVNGETVEKVNGRQAAEERLAELTDGGW